MNALQKLFARLRELFPAQAEELIEQYRADAAADSRASYQRRREAIQKLKEKRASAKKS